VRRVKSSGSKAAAQQFSGIEGNENCVTVPIIASPGTQLALVDHP